VTGRRTAAEVEVLFRRLGRDLQLGWAGPAGAFTDGDLAPATRRELGRTVTDLAVADDVDQAVQLLVNRLMTRRGELAPLGHPDYGSRHHELVGEPNTERTRNLVKVHVLEALRHEPRVAAVLRCQVDGADAGRPRDVVRVVLLVRLVDRAEPLNLVVPVELAG
jgi:phage baseplate assembly protein W